MPRCSAPPACRFRPARATSSRSAVQQAFGRWVVADVGYFKKHTTNGYDFGALFDTPIFFPVSWDHSKLDGIIGRVTLVEHKGFSASTVLGHTNAIFSPPGTGGILTGSAAGRRSASITTRNSSRRRTRSTSSIEPRGVWAAISWRYDSGLVAGVRPRLRHRAHPHGRPAGGHRPVSAAGTFAALGAPITVLRRSEPRRDPPSHSGGRHRGRPGEPAADRAAPSVRHRHRRRQPAAHGQGEAQGPAERGEPHEQGGALQLPVHLQRHALRHAARGAVPGGRDVLIGCDVRRAEPGFSRACASASAGPSVYSFRNRSRSSRDWIRLTCSCCAGRQRDQVHARLEGAGRA